MKSFKLTLHILIEAFLIYPLLLICLALTFITKKILLGIKFLKN